MISRALSALMTAGAASLVEFIEAHTRATGSIPLRDEAVAYRRQRDRIGGIARPVLPWDAPAFAVSFQATAIEGLEVVFIVVAVGAGGSGLLAPAILGAVIALVPVASLGMLLHRPITRACRRTR